MQKFDLSDFENISDVINKISKENKNLGKSLELDLDLTWEFYSESSKKITTEFNKINDIDN